MGDTIEAGHEPIFLESMKMEIPLPSPVAGRGVTPVPTSDGQRVVPGQPLVVVDPS